MKVFISWSGTKSKKTAEVLSAWIRQVIQAADTWISSDIEKGARWNEKVSLELEETKIGIICLNKENFHLSGYYLRLVPYQKQKMLMFVHFYWILIQLR